MNDLSEHGLLDYGELKQKAENATVHYKALSTQIKTAETRMQRFLCCVSTSLIMQKPMTPMWRTVRQAIPQNSWWSMKQTSCFTKPQNKPLRSWVMEEIRSYPLSKHCKRSMKNSWKKRKKPTVNTVRLVKKRKND